jgi:hypothetical protein
MHRSAIGNEGLDEVIEICHGVNALDIVERAVTDR